MSEAVDANGTERAPEPNGAEEQRRREQRTGRGWLTIGIAAVLLMLAAVTPSPYAIEQPGPVVDAFGTMRTESGASVDVIRVEGARTYPTSGELNVLSVSIDGTPDRPVDWISLLGTLFDQTRSAVPLSSLYPEGLSAEERSRQNAAMMLASQQSATAAALRRLGEPVGEKVRIAGVSADGPSEGKLKANEVIRSVEGAEVTSLAALRAAVAKVPEGDPVRLGVERGGRETEVSVTPQTRSDGTRLLGVTVNEEFTFPFEVKLDLENIGGPSAGLVFALAITDMLTPGELTGGKRISGTGTIDAEGEVGPIGGLQQKIWGAAKAGSTIMLMPIGNCADVPQRLPEGMKLVPVATLDEAVTALERVNDAGDPPGLERCRAASATNGG